jgi:hypothetical protein
VPCDLLDFGLLDCLLPSALQHPPPTPPNPTPQTANIPAADLLYVNYNNLVEGLLPYSVVLDAARRCVVVAIRGSLSVEDCVTGGCTDCVGVWFWWEGAIGRRS